jgi:hypothetical protein
MEDDDDRIRLNYSRQAVSADPILGFLKRMSGPRGEERATSRSLGLSGLAYHVMTSPSRSEIRGSE